MANVDHLYFGVDLDSLNVDYRPRKELRKLIGQVKRCNGIVDAIEHKTMVQGKYSQYLEPIPIGIYVCIKNCEISGFGKIDHVWIELPLELEENLSIDDKVSFKGLIIAYKKGMKIKRYGIKYGINVINDKICVESH